MRRDVPEHFKLNGRPKVPYDSKRKAKRVARIMKKNWYRCRFCDKYHIGG